MRTRFGSKQGAINEWHFAHDVGADCATGVESAIHRMGKQLIMDRKQMWVPSRVLQDKVFGPFDDLEHTNRWKQNISFEVQSEGLKFLTDCVEEKQIGSRRPDVFAKLDGRPIAIEVAYTHFCDEEKLQWLQEQNLTTLEINVEMPSDIQQQDILAELERRLFSPSHYSFWRVHAGDIEGQAYLVSEEHRLRESNAQEDANFVKALAVRRAEQKRKDDFKARIKDIELFTLKVGHDLTLRIARSQIRCTLKWFGDLRNVPERLKKATRDAAVKYGGKFNKGYYIWEYSVSEARVEGLYADIVAYMQNALLGDESIPITLEHKNESTCHPLPKVNDTTTKSPFYDLLSDVEREYFDERAAIMESDGGMPRLSAEKHAYDSVLRLRGRLQQ